MDPTNLRTLITQASAPYQHLVERLDEELRFADRLAELHPTEAAAWRRLCQRGRTQIAAVLGGGRLEAVPETVAAVEKLLAPVAAVAKSYTIHCIGHAHIDMNWMWSWPETVAVTVDTFATVLRLMDEYPEFTFSQSQASTYAIIEQHRPDLLKKIARRVKQGRWEVIASHWVEGDKNLASGESWCRHLLYTRAYLRHLFGLRPEDVPIDWSPDTFGHAATVPTYLVRGGIKYLYLHRPGVHTAHKPGAFWWRGPDGARVLVRNDMELGYNGIIGPEFIPHFFKFVTLTRGRDYLFVYGIGDHGGGPTRRDIVRIGDLNGWPVFPAVKFSTARAFYERLEQQAAELPVLDGELNTEFTGCYTTETLIKKANRFAEARLVDAEAASVLAAGAAGHRYPAAALLEAWRDTLFCQFHDILPGSGVHDTRTYAHGLFQKTMATTSQAELAALRAVAAQIDTSGAGEPQLPPLPPSRLASGVGAGVGFHSVDGQLPASEQSAGHGPRPFVLFNLTAADRTEIVEATIWDNAPAGSPPLKSRAFAVRQPDGTLLAPQVINGGLYWNHEFVSLAFPATVTGLGYAGYIITEESVPAPAPTARQLGFAHHSWYALPERSAEGLENDCLRLELDPVTGGIRSLTDKRNGLGLINAAAGTPTLEYAVERPHAMSAWCLEHTGPVESPRATALRRVLTGPYKASIEVDWQVHESTVTITYELRAGDPKLYLHVKGVWFQRGTREIGVPTLRLAFPLALRDARGRYEIPFGAIDRSRNHGEEVPALQWAQVNGQCGDQPAGCLLVNDCKHGHSLDGSTLRLTLIRSSYEPDILPEIGQHEAHVALQPFAGDLPVTQAIRIGQEFNHALRVIGTDVHRGQLAVTGQFARVAPEPVVLSALKKAEAGHGLVARLFNPTERKATARLELDPKLLGRITNAQETDLLEKPLAHSTAKVTGNTVSVTVPAHGIVSVLLQR